MRRINESKARWNTYLALSLIPLSGFAMDIFIPSLPDMASRLQATPAAIQLTLSIFMISYGVSQLVVGGLVDSFGRYWPNLISLVLFSLASFTIAYSTSLQLIYWMRVLQGFTVAVILVSKRAYFVDVFSGDRLKKYTSLFSVIWAIAPIVAPFLGGFFQTKWGWSSNFMFLGYFGLSFFIVECFTGGESIKKRQAFHLPSIVASYKSMLKARDFTSGLLILGLIYAMILTYGMSSPFLIENKLHFSPSVTGYCSLFSGVSFLIGGTVSRMLIQKAFFKKLMIASSIQLAAAGALITLTFYYSSLWSLLMYVFLLHSLGGFIFNAIISYCLIRFPQHAGKASGLVGGSFALVTSILCSVLVKSIVIANQVLLGTIYGILASGVFLLLATTKWQRDQEAKRKADIQYLDTSLLTETAV